MTRKFCAVIAVLVLSALCCGPAFTAESISGVKNADIVFFIDSSSSMGDDINGVRTNLAAFSNALVSNDVDVRFAIVEYEYHKGIIVHRPNSTDIWTSDPSQVEAVLSTIVAGGGDGYTLDAINEISSWGDFRSDAARFGFTITDVMRLSDNIWLNDSDFDYITSQDIATINTLMQGTVQQLNSMDMHMSLISTPGLRSPYQPLYSQTGGVFIDINTRDYYRSMLDMAQWISEEINTENPLPHALIQAVPDEILYRVSGDETVLQRIARLANISVDQINVITAASLDLRLPHEPTEAMRKRAEGEFIAKLDTLVLSFDSIPKGEAGYFLFQLELPDEVLSMALKARDVSIWYATPDEFVSASSAHEFRPAVFDPFTYFEITDLWGYEADTLAKKALVLVFCQAGQSLSMWLLKTLLILLAGGCSSGGITGMSAAILISVAGVLLMIKLRRKS